jgi:RimJ/RimL family protein N-acetyltransferase
LKTIKPDRACKTITLESLGAQHFERVAQWLSKPEINRWLTPEWRHKEASASIVAIAVRNRRNRLFLVLHNDVPCGLAGLADIETVDRTAMVWYFLGEETLAGQGITSVAVRELARVAFGQLELASLYAWAMEDNVASQKVLRNVGFREVGRIRQSAHSLDRQVDRTYFDLVPSDITVGHETLA